LIYDKAENNALKDASGASAWASLYSISAKKVRALNVKTNSFCAGGGWIGNGTLVSVGGNPQQTYINDKAQDGLAAIRLFTPCTNSKCDVYENPSRIRMTSPRWYPSTVRLTDGSLMIAGGMIAGGASPLSSLRAASLPPLPVRVLTSTAVHLMLRRRLQQPRVD